VDEITCHTNSDDSLRGEVLRVLLGSLIARFVALSMADGIAAGKDTAGVLQRGIAELWDLGDECGIGLGFNVAAVIFIAARQKERKGQWESSLRSGVLRDGRQKKEVKASHFERLNYEGKGKENSRDLPGLLLLLGRLHGLQLAGLGVHLEYRLRATADEGKLARRAGRLATSSCRERGLGSLVVSLRDVGERLDLLDPVGDQVSNIHDGYCRGLCLGEGRGERLGLKKVLGKTVRFGSGCERKEERRGWPRERGVYKLGRVEQKRGPAFISLQDLEIPVKPSVPIGRWLSTDPRVWKFCEIVSSYSTPGFDRPRKGPLDPRVEDT